MTSEEFTIADAAPHQLRRNYLNNNIIARLAPILLYFQGQPRNDWIHMDLHRELGRARRVMAAVLGASTLALCAGPIVASANIITPHFGLQLRGNQNTNPPENQSQNDGNGGTDQVNTDTNLQTNDDGNSQDPPLAVPEPGVLALFLVGLAGLAGAQLQRRSAGRHP